MLPGWAEGVHGIDLAPCHLHRNSFMAQPGLVRNEQKGRETFKMRSSGESKYLIGII